MGRSGVLQNKSLQLVHNFPSTFRADTNRVWLLLLLNLDWSALNRRFGDALPQPFAVLRRDLLVKPAPVWVGRGVGFCCAVRCCSGSCSYFICHLFKFIFFHLYFILYNVGLCGKHSKISFPSLKTKKPDKSPVIFFLTYFWNKPPQKINRKDINAAALLKASCRSMWLKMCLFHSLEQKNVFRVFFFAIFSEQMRLPCRIVLLLCCSAGLLKQMDERLWKRSTLFALEMLSIFDRTETPILPWTNSWRHSA